MKRRQASKKSKKEAAIRVSKYGLGRFFLGVSTISIVSFSWFIIDI